MVANSPLYYGSTCPPVTDSAGPRFHYQLGQVGAHPDSVPESGDYRYPPAAGAAQPEEDRHFVDPPPPGHGLDSPNIRSPTRGSVCVGTHAQLRRYCTKALDSAVSRIDAFSFRWEGFRGYAFPPISLIPRILYKVRQDRATILLIAPWGPKRTWFLEMITLVAGYPRILPVPRDVISQPISGTLHPWPASLHLTAWPLSERPERRQAFLNGLRPSLPAASGCLPGRLTFPSCGIFRLVRISRGGSPFSTSEGGG